MISEVVDPLILMQIDLIEGLVYPVNIGPIEIPLRLTTSLSIIYLSVSFQPRFRMHSHIVLLIQLLKRMTGLSGFGASMTLLLLIY